MKKTLGLTDAKKRRPANLTCLRRLARIWDERRTGLIRGVNGVIRLFWSKFQDTSVTRSRMIGNAFIGWTWIVSPSA